EARHLLRGVDGIALDDQADAGADANGLARDGRRGQGYERVHRVPVVPGQLGAAGPRRLTVGRNVRVLGDPEGLKAQIFRGWGQLAHGDRVLRREDRDPELHPLRLERTWTSPSCPTLGTTR